MKFSGKMCFKIILKVTKNQGSTLSIEDTSFRKTTGEGQFDSPPGILVLNRYLLTTTDELSDQSRIAVFTCQNKLIRFIETKIQLLSLNKVILWSHRFGVQFHSRFVFTLFSKSDLTKSFEWDNNKARRGKRPMDGVGVTVKNLVFRAVKNFK